MEHVICPHCGTENTSTLLEPGVEVELECTGCAQRWVAEL